MRVAVIGDIHGNIYALKSVLDHIDEKNVDFIVSTGDLVGYLNYPNEVIELLKNKKILSIKGNHDKIIGESVKVSQSEIEKMKTEEIHKSASRAYTNWCISDDNRKYLNELPESIVFSAGPMKIILVHGSPASIDEYLYEEELELAKTAKTIQEDIIICGHTHIPYFRKIAGKYFINAGSVGKPKHGNSNSTYVIVDISEKNVNCMIEQVKYPVEKMVEDIIENSMISSQLVEALQDGK